MKIFGTVLGVVVVVLIAFLGYYGLFARITVEEKNLDSFWMVYQKHIGEYKDVGPVMDGVYNGLKDDYSVTTTRGFGLYYDDPRTVPGEECRSIVGCILEKGDAGRVDELREKYFVREYPASKIVTAGFPSRGKLSIIIGIFKVYPKLGKYIKEKGYAPHPMFEIYDVPGKKTIYGMSTNVDVELFNSFLEKLPEPEVVDSVEVVEEEKTI